MLPLEIQSMGNFPVDTNGSNKLQGKEVRGRGKSYGDQEKLQKLLSQRLQFILKSICST